MSHVSPFTPGSPAPIDLFVGREYEVETIQIVAGKASAGRLQGVSLTGERGIGKTSLAMYLRHMVEEQDDYITVHVALGGVKDIDDLVRCILERVLEKTQGKKYGQKIQKFIEKNFGGVSVSFGGIGVSFSPKADKLQDLRRRFPIELKRIVDLIHEEHAGLFLVLDDLSTFSENVEFANWLKAFVDTVGVDYPGGYPLILMIVGLPDDRKEIFKAQPSLLRCFNHTLTIKRLHKEEVTHFYTEAFDGVEVSVSPQAMHYMVNWSSGIPVVMHQIGDAAFELAVKAKSGKIDAKIARQAIITAADKIGMTYLEEPVYKAIRSPSYRSILRKLGKSGQVYFTKHDMESQLDEAETNVFHNFLRKMREAGVIELNPDGPKGSYRFTNGIYLIYAWLEAERHGQKLRVEPIENDLGVEDESW